MDRRVLAGLAAGLVGLALGVAALIVDVPLLGLLAGVCALGTTAAVLVLGATLRMRQAEMAGIEAGLVTLQEEVSQLQDAAAAGQEAIRVAGNFAEMVALRNVELTRQVDRGGLVDDPTGLLDGRYFEAALQNRVAAARRLLRPVSVVLLQLDGLGEGGRLTDEELSPFAEILRETLREADTACRVDETCFGLLLEDTPEGGGVWAAERIRGALARNGGRVQSLSAGVASYPTHALESGQLLSRARAALDRARATGRGRVEVAPAD